MKFLYDKKTKTLSIYARANENQVVSTEGELKVLEKKFDEDGSVREFLEDFTVLIQHIFNILYDGEEIKDVLVISKTPNHRFTWWSLTDTEASGISHNPFDLLMEYGLLNFERIMPDEDEPISSVLNPRDQAKLALAQVLLKSIRVKGQKRENIQRLKRKLGALEKRLKPFEEKHDFTSDLMYRYYSDDELPENDFSKWIEVYEEYLSVKNTVAEAEAMEDLMDTWLKTFEKTTL